MYNKIQSCCKLFHVSMTVQRSATAQEDSNKINEDSEYLQCVVEWYPSHQRIIYSLTLFFRRLMCSMWHATSKMRASARMSNMGGFQFPVSINGS